MPVLLECVIVVSIVESIATVYFLVAFTDCRNWQPISRPLPPSTAHCETLHGSKLLGILRHNPLTVT